MKLATKASRFAAKVHRILGTSLALLMASWFISGAVMLSSSYPYASAEERLATVLPLQAADLAPLPAGAFIEMVAAGQELKMFQGPDGLVVIGPDGYVTTHGTPVGQRSKERCLEVLQQANPTIHTKFKEVVSEVGQWTVPEQVRSHLPLYLYEDEQGERHYLDPHGCVLAQHSTRSERFWAYFGAIPHWLRPTLRLHHLTGLAFGLLTFTWLLSGAINDTARVYRFGLPSWYSSGSRHSPLSPNYSQTASFIEFNRGFHQQTRLLRKAQVERAVVTGQPPWCGVGETSEVPRQVCLVHVTALSCMSGEGVSRRCDDRLGGRGETGQGPHGARRLTDVVLRHPYPRPDPVRPSTHRGGGPRRISFARPLRHQRSIHGAVPR